MWCRKLEHKQIVCLVVEYSPGTLHKKLMKSWDGTSWTEVNDLNTARNLTKFQEELAQV